MQSDPTMVLLPILQALLIQMDIPPCPLTAAAQNRSHLPPQWLVTRALVS